MMNNYCCNSNKCGNDSKAMYSVDYDSLIEDLTHTRDEIDSLIKTLEARKYKDKTINDILSSDYEEEKQDDIDVKRELEELLKDIMEKPVDEIVKKKNPNTITNYPNTTYPYRRPYWWTLTYPYTDVWY